MGSVSLPKPVWFVIHIYTAASLFLDFVTDCYFLSKTDAHWKIYSGIDPKYVSFNLGFYLNISILSWLLMSLLLAVVEILLMLDLKFVEKLRSGFLRPALYLLMGIAHLGVCGDLGIAAGSLTIIAGAFWLGLELFLTFAK